MSKRMEAVFAALAENGRKALIPYISAGDPLPEQCVNVMHALVAGGANILELGIPFSDPAADGETIQLANERALARGVSLPDVLAIAAEFRQQDSATPIVLMGYLNSFERRGFAQSMQAAAQSGVDAVILVDCPIEALPDYAADLSANNMTAIQLLAPTTGAERQHKIIAAAEGFIYYVSLRGVTGKQEAQAQAIRHAVEDIKTQTKTPVCIGFGIRDGATAKAMAAFADGVIIGSALVAKLWQAAQEGQDVPQAARTFVETIRQALDN